MTETMHRDQEFLTMDDVAEILGVSHATVFRHIRDHGLPAHRLGPRLVRIRRDELNAWVGAQGA